MKSKRLISMVLSFVMLLSLIGSAVPVAAEQTETPDLRVGILSDIHLGYAWDKEVQTPRFKKALTAFKDMGVDAIIVAGDLQDVDGEGTMDEQKRWVEEFAATWFEVFPADSGVEPVFIYGNHDIDLIAAKYWPNSLGTYTDAFIKEVNGYQFVGVHNGKEDLSIVDEYIAQAAEQSVDKPFFYIQHCPLYQSVVQSDYYSSYSLNYRGAGHQNLKAYSNAVAFHGHTHVPLTDERSIWQGDDWSEGKYTAINTATLNYAGTYARISENNTDVVDVNERELGKSQTQHGMYMTVTGSQVSIDRYSFYEDAPVKIGATWSFDACNENDRPYTYDGRYEAATAPVFADGASITVGEVTEDSVTVSIPAASLSTDGNGDMIQSYLVEAVDPVTGIVKASNAVLTEYHIDNSSRFGDSYTVTVSGLEQGRTYIVNAYAREFFQKKSTPLTATVTTAGIAQPGQAGDVNGDGAVNAADLTLLQEICAGTADNTAWSDVDGNCITESVDLIALENLLAGKKAVSEDPAVDVLGASTYIRNRSFSGINWSTAMQTAVTKNGTGVALKVAATTAAGWPFVEVLFDEPQDWSGKNVLEFDTLFDTDSGWIAVTLISGEDLALGTVGTAYQTAMDQPFVWSSTAKTIKLSDFANVDFTAVRGIRFAYNLAEYEGRFDGVKEHAVYVDNVRASYVPAVAADLDLLGTANITGGEKVYAVGQTNGSNEAVKSQTGTLTVALEKTYILSRYAALNVDSKLIGSGTVTVQALAADGSALGQAAVLNAGGKWSRNALAVSSLGLPADGQVAQLRFSFTAGCTLYLDNMSIEAMKDTDLIGTSSITYGNGAGLSCNLQSDVTNNSNSAVAFVVTDSGYNRWPTATLNLANGVAADTTHFTVDVERTSSDWYFRVEFLDENNAVLGNHLIGTGAKGWQTHEFKLSELSEDSITDEEISQIQKVRFTPSLLTGLAVGDAVYVDNASFIARDADVVGSSTITYKNVTGHSVSLQNAVTNDSKDALKVEVTDASNYYSWPQVIMTMSEPVDGTMTHFTIDDEQTYTTGSLKVEFLNNSGTLLGKAKIIYGSAKDTGWRTNEFELSDVVTAEQIGQIQQVRITLYPQTGLEAGSAIYLDNAEFFAKDTDILSTTDITYKSMVSLSGKLQREVTNGSNEAVAVTVLDASTYYQWPVLSLNLNETVDASMTHFTVDVERTYSDSSFRVKFYDADGNELGNHLHSGNDTGWQMISFKLTEMNKKAMSQEDIGKITRVEFLLYFDKNLSAGSAIYLDNAKFFEQKEDDTDLIGTSEITFAANTGLSCAVQADVTNNSHQAIKVAVANEENYGRWPTATLLLADAVDPASTYFTVDVERTYSDTSFRVQFLDADGAILGNHVIGSEETGWQTHKFRLSKLSVDSLTDSELSAVKQVKFTFYLDDGLKNGDAMYVDNASFLIEEIGADEITEAETDLLASMTFVKNTGSGYTPDMNSTEVCGTDSIRSYSFSAPAGASSWPYSFFRFNEALDMTGATLEFDIKFAGGKEWTRVQFFNSAGTKTGQLDYTGTGEEGWQHVSMDLSNIVVSDVLELAFGFNCENNNTVDRVFYIDNLQVIYAADNAASGVAVAAVYNTDNYTLTDTVTGTSTLSFHSAKGETEAAQLVITPSKAISAYSLSMTDAVSASGNVIPASAFAVYAADYIEVTDALNGGKNGFFRMP